MLQRGQTAANFVQVLAANLTIDDPFTFVHPGEDFAPRIDKHTVAVGQSSVGMTSALCRCENITLILDCAGT